MKVSLVLKGNPDQFNRLPICIRVNEGEKRFFTTTQYRATKEEFADGKLPGHATMRDMLREMVLQTELDLFQKNKKYRDAEFFEYTKECLKEFDSQRAYNTMKKYKAEINKLKGFRSSFKLSHIDHRFLKGYQSHLRTEEENQPNTIWTAFRFLHMIIQKAVNEKIIAENPFTGYDMPKYRNPEVNYLTKDQVKKIEEYLPKAGSMKFSATWFLIGCYTGLRYSDMNAFEKDKHIRDGRLVLYTTKTGELVSMPLSEKVKGLLERIAYQSMFISNQKYNAALVKIAERAKVGEITAHASRHSFGVMCAAAGISIEVTARLLGHASTKTTQIYYKLANPRIDAELDKLYL